MNKTSIEWVKNPDGTQGYTWNPITGCLNGCDYCYARKLANGRLKTRYLANKNIAEPDSRIDFDMGANGIFTNPFYPRFWPERLEEIKIEDHPRVGWISNVYGKGIFVCDMSDLFGIGIPEEWTQRVMAQIRLYKQHLFYLLTKQPQNLIKWSPFPDNCWVGVTVCNQAMANESIPTLMNIIARKRYISIEPMLEPIDLSRIEFGRYLPENEPYYVSAFKDRYIFGDEGDIELKKIDWVIIGAQTKPTVMPKIEWVKEIVQACDEASIPVFLKDNLKPLLRSRQPYTNDESQLFIRLTSIVVPDIRQEMPKVK